MNFSDGMEITCVKDYVMEDGELAFLDSFTYSVIGMADDGMVILLDEQADPHYMSEEDINEYFELPTHNSN